MHFDRPSGFYFNLVIIWIQWSGNAYDTSKFRYENIAVTCYLFDSGDHLGIVVADKPSETQIELAQIISLAKY